MVKNLPANAGDARDEVQSLGGRKWQPTPVFLPEEFHGQEEPGGLLSTGWTGVRHD